MEGELRGRVDKRSARTADIAMHTPEQVIRQALPEEQRETWGIRLQRDWPFLGVVLLAALLRFIGLGDKPLHHDESLHAYFSLQLLHNMERWQDCLGKVTCYHYDPLLHGPFQFHAIALVYKISQLLGAPDHGVNTTTVRIAAALLGTVLVGCPYFLRDYLGGRLPAWLACCLLAISPSMVYFSRFAREDIYMACFTLVLVLAAGRYVRDRKGYWLALAAASFTLSYATKEATFLTVAIFGSFLAILLVWELGIRRPWPEQWQFHIRKKEQAVQLFPRTAAPFALFAFGVVCLPLVRWFFSLLKSLSISIANDTSTADRYVQSLKEQTQSALPWLGVAVLLWVGALLVRDMLAARRPDRRPTSVMVTHVDPELQPLLSTLLTTPWVHWFFALNVGVCIFVLLFSVMFTNLHHGLSDGVWQGIYYWLQQQNVARGGQPWYYYLLLIPLYEQLGLVFALVGLVRSLRRPTRFRLFLLYWLVGNVALYSWAGEKMPWLMIHMTMPMILLAAIGLEPVVRRCMVLLQAFRQSEARASGQRQVRVQTARSIRMEMRAHIITVLLVVMTFFLLILTLQNMFQVTFVHYADGPHEMMIYVQSTKDVDTIMDKVARLDRLKHDGRHNIAIGVMSDALWPFYWYLRDYTNVCYGFPTGCTDENPEVIIGAGEDILKTQLQYTERTTNDSRDSYAFHRYHLRSWWDEGYKPPACVPSATVSCQGQPTWGGVGPLLWLSYGDTLPAQAQFQPLLAARNVWNWWWLRAPIGRTNGSTDVGLMIRSDLSDLVRP